MVDVSGTARLTDFGLTTIVRDQNSLASAGDDQGFTPRWTAPEVLQFGKTTKESDVFSFGMVIIEVGGGRSVIFATLFIDEAFHWKSSF